MFSNFFPFSIWSPVISLYLKCYPSLSHFCFTFEIKTLTVCLILKWFPHCISFYYIVCFFFSGAFLIPYIFFMCVIGMPLLFMEYSFGQYFGVGGLTIFKRLCPMFQGEWLNINICVHLGLVIHISYLSDNRTCRLDRLTAFPKRATESPAGVRRVL